MKIVMIIKIMRNIQKINYWKDQKKKGIKKQNNQNIDNEIKNEPKVQDNNINI